MKVYSKNNKRNEALVEKIKNIRTKALKRKTKFPNEQLEKPGTT